MYKAAFIVAILFEALNCSTSNVSARAVDLLVNTSVGEQSRITPPISALHSLRVYIRLH